MYEGACVNTADCGVIDVPTDVSTIAGGCGQCCLEIMDATTCAAAGLTFTLGSTCVPDCIETVTSLSTDCTMCYAGATNCGVNNCLTQCAADPSAAACDACLETNCRPEFYTCSGMGEGAATFEPTCGNLSDIKSGACLNATDCAVIDVPTDVATIAGGCGQCCLEIMDEATCTAAGLTFTLGATCVPDCIQAATTLSTECTMCYATTTGCGASQCLTQCAADPTAAACQTCLDTNCRPAFYTCSGLE
jgi:hypothetical protein